MVKIRKKRCLKGKKIKIIVLKVPSSFIVSRNESGIIICTLSHFKRKSTARSMFTQDKFSVLRYISMNLQGVAVIELDSHHEYKKQPDLAPCTCPKIHPIDPSHITQKTTNPAQTEILSYIVFFLKIDVILHNYLHFNPFKCFC